MALGAGGEGASAEAEDGSGKLVVVPVVQAGEWKGSSEASVAADRLGSPTRRRGKVREKGPGSCGVGGEDQGSGSSLVKAGRKGDEKSGVQKPGRHTVMSPGRAEKAEAFNPNGLGQGGNSPALSSPSKNKLKGVIGLSLGPGCCWGPGQMQVGQEGGPEEGGGRGLEGLEGGAGRSEGKGGSPIARGKAGTAAGGGGGSPGKGLWKKGSGKERKGDRQGGGVAGREGGSPGNGGCVSRERSRSPVGVRRGRGGGLKPPGVSYGSDAKETRQTHGDRVARIRRAVLGEMTGEGVEDRGEGKNFLWGGTDL